MLPFASGITGYYTEKDDVLYLELRSLRNLRTTTFTTKDATVINTIKQGFSPILEDYLGDNLPGFNDAFFNMQEHPLPIDGEEREFEIYSNTKMKFCWVPAGKATLGSPKNEKGRNRNERQHEFETNGFWMAKYLVTQAQWESVMGNSPSYFNGANLPVEQVSWEDCYNFIKKCSASGGLRLPHEDQWEYACRGGMGNKQAFYWGDILNGDKANCKGIVQYGTSDQGIYLRKTAEVGSYEKVAPHPWGLCDMLGNVWEWCDNPYGKEDLDRTCRGGSWANISSVCRSSYRGLLNQISNSKYVGFRLIIC